MGISRLSVKLFLAYAALNLALALGFVTLVANWQHDLVLEQVETQLRDTAIVLGNQLSETLADRDAERLQDLVGCLAKETSLRITLVDAQGKVLADSHEAADRMDNHLIRPEISQAEAAGLGKQVRYSETLHQPMFYLAVSIRQDQQRQAFVRVAAPIGAIDEQVATLHRWLWWSALAVGTVALLLTMLVAGRIIRPLAQLTAGAEAIAAGDYGPDVPARGYDELGTLGRAFNFMRRQLARTIGELRENSQRLETVLSGMVEGVIAVDPDQRVLFANHASRSLLGIDAPEIISRPLFEVTRSQAVPEAVAAALSREEPYEAEFETRGKVRRQLALRATRLPGAPCPGVVIVLYDVTELRRLENHRREFVANVSHELKTPLSSIKAYAETLRLGAVRDAEHNVEFVTRIEEQAERLHQLIQDLLQLARVESGKETFDIRPLAIADVIERVKSEYTGRAQAKHLSLEFAPPDQPVFAKADAEGLITILDNLVSNALQYTPPGGRVTVCWRAEADAVVLEVEDTGIGIAPQDQERVFERFYRVDKARSRELGGTGLGLAIVKHLTGALGGAVGLRSEEGRGSTFSIRLPRG